MSSPLPSNEDIIAFSQAVPWKDVEQAKRRFNEALKDLAPHAQGREFPLDQLSQATGLPLTLLYDDSTTGNVILGTLNGRQIVMGSFVSERFRFGKPLMKALVAYNLNPAVNHSNLHETDNPTTQLRALGAELELGLYHPDGGAPTEEEVLNFDAVYRDNAHRMGITPTVDREACMYQVEVHIAPGIGYHRARKSLDSILHSLVLSADATGLRTAIMASYPILSDFRLTDDPKVHSAVDVMMAANRQFPAYEQRQADIKARYHMDPAANVVEIFRNQGCHIHLDLAGRSEALGIFSFYTVLRSATAIVNAAVLKGSPFVNGTCDAERLCTREYLRAATVTARYIDMPLSPHLMPDGLHRYGHLLHSERANSTPPRPAVGGIGRHRRLRHAQPHRAAAPRSGDEQAHLHAGEYRDARQYQRVAAGGGAGRFRVYACADRELLSQAWHGSRAAARDKALWAIIGPLTTEQFMAQQDLSDRQGTDMVVTTAAGTQMTLAEFYEMKRRYMHRHLTEVAAVTPRDIDDVYVSLIRMLEPPSGRVAETPEQYIADVTTRSTGNWGRILRNAFIEEGGVPGSHNPDAVLRVANRVHESLRRRYGQGAAVTGD